MNDRVKLFRAMGVSGLAGVLVACLVFTIDLSATAPNAMGARHDHIDTFPSCDGMSDASQPTFYAEMTRVNAQMHEGMEIVPSGDVDRDFMRMMIPHHQGAIEMALVVLKHGRDDKLKRLAQSIIVEQGQEIALMRNLLAHSARDTSNTNPIADQSNTNSISDQ